MDIPPAGPFAVVLGGKEDLRPDVLARVLGRFRGVTVMDGAMLVRRGRGILAEDLDRAGAEELAKRLLAEGIAAVSVSAAAIPALPPALLLSRAAPEAGGLRATIRHGEERAFPWERMRLVALAPFTETVYRKVEKTEGPSGRQMAMSAGIMAVTGMPMRIGAGKKVERVVPKSEFHLFLDLCLRDPAERLRVDGGRFDFSGLGERMTFAPLANVRVLLEEVVRAAPGAATSPGADLLLQGGRLATLGYDSVGEFEREERWLLAVAP